MFQMQNAPPKLPSWQDYFVRSQKGEDCFPAFLHHYEPVLNNLAKGFADSYGLQGHFADIKMTCVETMLTELETYEPSEGADFLIAIKRKLDASFHAYAMANLKGFSETSATHYYQLRKVAYISKSFPKDTVIPEICDQLNIQPKTAMRLLEEVYALDTFQWFSSGETENGLEDIPVGIDILGHCRTPQPEGGHPQRHGRWGKYVCSFVTLATCNLLFSKVTSPKLFGGAAYAKIHQSLAGLL